MPQKGEQQDSLPRGFWPRLGLGALILFMALGTAVVGVFLWAVIATTLRQRRLSKLPPPPPFRCPACNSDQVHLISSGLWDAIDLQTDKRSSGCDDYGICTQCGSRC